MSKVFNIVVQGGSDTPTATLTVDGEFTMGAAQQAVEWAITIFCCNSCSY